MMATVVKGGSLAVALFTTPAYMYYFNNAEVLGVWFTLLSVLAWILNCDMGIGNGLRNQLVYAINAKDWLKAKKYISSSYFFLFGIGIAILLSVLIIENYLSWNKVFNISSELVSERTMIKVVQILFIAIVLQFILRLATSILYALQEAFVPGLLNLATNLIMLIFVVFSNKIGENNNLILLAVVYLIAVNLPLVIVTFWIFIFKIPDASPSIVYFRKNYAFSVLKVGSLFLWLQIIAMIVDNTNNYLIALFIGNSAVVEYQIYSKIFNIPMTLVMLLTTSLWSTITKAKAEDDWGWIQASYDNYMKIAGLISIAEFAVILPLQWIFNIWLGDKSFPVNYYFAAVFALSGSVMSLRTILANYSNGLCELKIQTIYMTIGAIINIPLAFIFSKILENYISIVLANIVSMLPYCIAQITWCRNFFKKRLVR
ncbi:lipopolysaccharide biosynthesis protein [Acidaminococcus fermentans]|uniref:lipopolysaccharide biosynthesis protein n=1 Tax=Acidaminococcus fermentans TaxID=905 RepID=UPI003D012D9E